jgi:hypothetical protein
MRAMVHDECHPDVSLSHWEAFRNEASPYLLEKVLDRNETRLPRRFLPLARGAGIASPYLLRRAGYRPGLYRARGWFKPNHDQVWKEIGRSCLIVLRCKPFWRITRDHGATTSALVHIFGSTPILTRTYQEATYLAEFCWKGIPLPTGLCWVHDCPDDVDDAIDFAFQRGINEARAAHSLAA